MCLIKNASDKTKCISCDTEKNESNNGKSSSTPTSGLSSSAPVATSSTGSILFHAPSVSTQISTNGSKLVTTQTVLNDSNGTASAMEATATTTTGWGDTFKHFNKDGDWKCQVS